MAFDPYEHRGSVSAMGLLRWVVSGVRMYQAAKGWQRSDASEDRIIESGRKVDAMADFLNDPTPSGLLGDARLGTLEDAERASMLDASGFYLGALQGVPLFYSGGAHLLTYARTGSGKGRDVILPNMAHNRHVSMLVVDVKDGENAYASARHRHHQLGHKVVFINPFNLHQAGNACINPLARLPRLAAAGERVETAAREIVQILIPAPKKSSDSAWVANGAQRTLVARLCFLAYYRPAECLLSSLWRFVNQGMDKLLADLGEMILCDRPTISGPADATFSLVQEAPKQWEAYRSEMQLALDAYEPGSELEAATSADEFDLAELKDQPCTVYLMVPSEKLGVAAQWISLLTNHAIETIAARPGPVRTLFLLDEVAQLPPMPGMMKALRLYRGRGISLWFFCQGRFSLQERYPPEVVKEIEDQADVIQLFMPEEPSLLKDIETWSGKCTVAVRGVNQNGGQVEGLSMGISEQARPVLQAEDIRALGQTRQLLKVPGFPLFVADRPPFFEIDPFRDQLGDVRDVARGDVVINLGDPP